MLRSFSTPLSRAGVTSTSLLRSDLVSSCLPRRTFFSVGAPRRPSSRATLSVTTPRRALHTSACWQNKATSSSQANPNDEEVEQVEEVAETSAVNGGDKDPTTTTTTTSAMPQEDQWLLAQGERYGPGTYALFRSVYKDLCDEMRREYYTKPPPPLHGGGSTPVRPPPPPPTYHSHNNNNSNNNNKTRSMKPEDADAGKEKVEDKEESSWSARYDAETNLVVFQRGALPASRQCRILAYSVVELKDPPKLNSLLTFADWFPVEVLLERRGVVVHLSMAANEGGMHMRNVRVYELPSATAEGEGPTTETKEGEEKRDYVWGTTDDAQWLRQNLNYDGPCLWHLELDLQNELYDIMQDHGVDLDWMRWAAEWVSYVEHVCYTRWCLGMLEALIPEGDGRGPEEHFLTPGERAALDEPVEDWLEARSY